MKKFMQKDLSKAPNFVNRAISRASRILSQRFDAKPIAVNVAQSAMLMAIGSAY
jgi:hypothetical protein